MGYPVDHSATPPTTRTIGGEIYYDQSEGGFRAGDVVTCLINDDGLMGQNVTIESVESYRTVMITTQRGSRRYCVAALSRN